MEIKYSIISYSHSDSDVMILRPEIIIVLFENIYILISLKVTRNWVDDKGDYWIYLESNENYEWSRWNLTLQIYLYA